MFAVWDIENIKSEQDDKIELDFEGRKIIIGFYDGQQFLVFDDFLKFIDYIMKIRDSIKVMYAHNSSRYDNRLFIQYYDELVKKGYKVAFKDINSRILVSVSKDERTVRFLDSQLLLLSSLEKLSKAFNVQHKKLKVDYRNLTKKELIKYLKHDAMSLYEMLTKFFKLVEQRFGLSINEIVKVETLPQLAWKILFKFVDKNKFVNYYTKEEEDYLRNYYFGGRVEPFILKGEDLYYYDVNSLYPFVMANYEYPIGKAKKGISTHEFLNKLLQEEKLFIIEAKVKHQFTLYPTLPVRKEGKLLFPYGSFWGFFTSAELQKAIELGLVKVEQINKIYYWDKSERLFSEFVETLYNERVKAKKEGNDALQYLLKILLNSSYGKFGQRRIWNKLSIMDIKEALKRIKEWKKKNKEFEILYWDLHKVVASVKDISYSNRLVNVQYALFITSYARKTLLDYIYYGVERGAKVFYSDTDSLIVDKRLLKVEDKYALGKLKLEDKIQRFVTLGAKQYVYKNDSNKLIIKFKGVKKEILNRLYNVKNMKELIQVLTGEQIIMNDEIDVFDFFEMLLGGAKFRVKIKKLIGIKEFFRRKDIEKDWIFKTIDVLKEIRKTIEEKRLLVKNSVITYPKYIKD